MANEFDVIVIGAGTGGYPAAIRAAQLGLKVAVVERQKALGGTCLIWGCIPTKALLEHAHALKIAQSAKEWGLTIHGGQPVRIDMNQVQARKDRIVTVLTRGDRVPLQEEQRSPGSRARARLAGTGTVEVTGEQDADAARAKEIVVATGSAPRSVPGVEIDRKRIITSDEAIAMRDVPKSMVILGSGADRRRVRHAVQAVRERGDHHRTAAAPGAARGRGDVGRAREVVPEAGHRVPHVHDGDRGAGAGGRRRDRGARWPDGKVQTLKAEYLLVATGRGPVTNGPRRRGSRHQNGQGLHRRRRAVQDQRAEHVGHRRRDHVRHAGPSATGPPVDRRG